MSTEDDKIYRRQEAADYLKKITGQGSPRTLAKLATIGGGPKITYFGRIPCHTKKHPDEYAQSRRSPPVSSTSERRAQIEAQRRSSLAQEGA